MSFDRIRALNDREKSRDKLPIFYGSRDNFMHGFREVAINNTIDEIVNNFESGDIYITLHDDDKTITVEDTGRGMPIAGESDGVPNWELFFTTLFASGKYDSENMENSGTNGVGGTILNYSSTIYNVTSYHDGKEYIIEFENGGYIKTPLTYIGKTDKHGTKITFKLDKECYTKTKYDHRDLISIINKVSSVSPKTIIHFTYKGETTSYHYDTMLDYFESNIGKEGVFELPLLTYSTKMELKYPVEDGDIIPEEHLKDEITKIQVVMSAVTDGESVQDAFLNRNHLIEGGVINSGIVNGVRLSVNKFLKENAMYNKNEKAISNDDVGGAIHFLANVLSSNVEYQSQTKFSTQKKLYGKLVQEYIQDQLEIVKVERREEFKKLAEKILINKRANEKADSIRKDIKKKLSEKVDNIHNRIGDLIDCIIHGLESELYIAEGKSALGSIVLARNPKFQAAIPIRGKILNCLKADLSEIFKSQIIMDLIKAIGCGIETDKLNKELGVYSKERLRYGKIILAADADPDGGNIICLLLTMIKRLIPSLIKEGRVFIAKTPLYEVRLKDDTSIYWYSEAEKETEIGKYNNIKTINRAKGLGELEATTMSECAMNPETRRLVQVTIDDVEKMEKAFEMWMDKDTSQRKEYLENNLYKYVDMAE